MFSRSSSYPVLSMQPPLDDYNSWYYPSHGYTSDEEHPTDIQRQGNWGRKSSKGARWIRKGKMAAWGSGLEDWEVCIHQESYLTQY